MTAVIYARYSSDSQREASIEGQLRDCKDYAEKNGITVVGTYIDRAYSAKTDDRPDFQRMIKDSGKKIFDVVLVWKLDRFARNRFDAVNYKYQLEKNGVHLVSAMEPISQGPEGIMVESMLIGMAEYYSAELALKVARGERENALQCKYNGGVVPLGFTIGKEDRLYHIDPETAPIVQEIFSRYADGEPAEKIAASLNERGLRTRTGKPFVKNSFFQIFRNRRYIGEYRYKDIVTPGGIPAIVDEDLFNRVQQRFEQNKIAHGRPAKEDVSYLLTTKLFCGKCGTLMGGESGTSHMGNTYYYYKCGNAKRHGKAHCDLKAIRKEPLERFVVDTAIKVIFSDEIIEQLIDLVMEAQQKENTRLPVLKDQLRDTEKRLANLLEAIEQGILTPTTKQRLDELEARKEALNTSILEEELKKPVLTREWMRFWFEKFRKGDMRDMEHQRQIIDTFVNSVYVFDDRVVLNFNFTDDSKTISREEVLGSSAVDNAPAFLHQNRLRYGLYVDWRSAKMISKKLSLNKVCIILATTILLLSVVMFSVLYILTKEMSVVFCSMAFGLLFLLCVTAFVILIRRKLTLFSEMLCCTLDEMMNGKIDVSQVAEEENLFYKINHRLVRLYEVMQESKNSVASERADLQELISDISHQVKTPIANLKMINATLLEQEVPPDKQREFLLASGTQLDKLDFLMQAMIKTSRLETGVISLEKKQQPIYDTLAMALGGIFLNAERKHIQVEVNCPETLVVSHDRKWTAEALFNILDNAVKYTPEYGSIRVCVESWEMHLKVSITDTGKGIPENQQGAIFRRFYREEDVHDIEGIGIGLYLAREIISLQNGYIQVTSQVGTGSTFSVFLPHE